MRQGCAFLVKAVAAAAWFAATAATALAGPTTGSVSITSLGTQTTSPSDSLSTDTTLNLAGPFFTQGNGSGGLNGLTPGLSVTFSQTTFAIYSDALTHVISPFTVSMASSSDTYTFSLDEERTISRNVSNVVQPNELAQLNVGFIGTLTDSLKQIDSSASLQIGLTQTGGAGQTMSFSGTAAYPASLPPPSNVPEPASLTALVVGLAGLAGVRPRRR